jgi:RHH-type proline utilization regulon transcriptional repressor/proline dehydrogenase/delta 1-pyrroline-5-carboxylate dehydrogenase
VTEITRFAEFAPPVGPRTPLREAITAAARLPETTCVPPLLDAASIPDAQREAVRATARQLVERLRARPVQGGVQALVQEYALNSEEGVALMCLAEALLRIPDTATRDALIRDKVSSGDWAAHLGDGRSLFVNAATWGLVLTGKFTASADDAGLGAALARILGKVGEPLIRGGLDLAMRLLGEQFVTGETIEQALERAAVLEARGFTYSYDMLGEAAVTEADAARYYDSYAHAIEVIGTAAHRRGVYAGPGISIKLSALHPRYSRAQAARVMAELLPRARSLALMARARDIGFNIDAEEADRLELSLDILESLAVDARLAGWNGLGFVVQAYGKRCPRVIDFIIDLARRSGRRIMLRLVKGAYWDAEIKRAQQDGLADYPVYTRKVYTDVAYLACARRMLAARDAVFPQFATHNAQSLASIYHLAGDQFRPGDYEFQCLHGMGEALYGEVVGADKLDRPCRIYAPVGTHETLLAYLVRRLLENGANSSFVNRINDPDVPVEELIADPVEAVRRMPQPGAPHERIGLPAAIYGARRNSAGLDLSDEATLAMLRAALPASAAQHWQAAGIDAQMPPQPICNPADARDVVGRVVETSEAGARQAAARALVALPAWAATPATERAACLERAADELQRRMPELLGLLIREAGKSAGNAVGEVRESIDFLRYYAAEARRVLAPGSQPLGPVACISPWNFPLSIFTGQIAAALAAGNTVLAKPAEETPLIAAQAVRILHAAGVPVDALQLLPGDGRIGAALVVASEIAGVIFTGSTEVARLIQAELAGRVAADGRPIPLIAETGGQNAMIVDSSALPEQVVVDALVSAFDSAGQRCSALRLLCLQEEIADHVLTMLRGAMHELRVGNPARLAVDVGPVISAVARDGIERHVEAMRRAGRPVERFSLGEEAKRGTFVAPTLIEIESIAELRREVFGPVLHVIRYRREELDALIAAINATGYGLTFGLHSRLDSTIAEVTRQVHAGNLYVNRNIIGAVVGVQPFGGRGLSGTGPKAGGPLYLPRLVRTRVRVEEAAPPVDPACVAVLAWLDSRAATQAQVLRQWVGVSRLGREQELQGPAGERNVHALLPRGRVALLAQTRAGLFTQLAAVLATGNHAVIQRDGAGPDWLPDLPPQVAARITWSADALLEPELAAALVEGERPQVLDAARRLAARPGAIVPLQAATSAELAAATGYELDGLLEEVSTSINTTAAGGNTSLLALA